MLLPAAVVACYSSGIVVWLEGKKEAKTYNTEDSQVVTDPSTNSALSSLSMGERTGSRVFWKLWSYVMNDWSIIGNIANMKRGELVASCSLLLSVR